MQVSPTNHAARDDRRLVQGAAAAAGVVGGVVAAKIIIEQMKELVEQSATEWVLDNWEYKDGDIIEVKLFEWEMKSLGDLSGARSIVFKVKQNE